MLLLKIMVIKIKNLIKLQVYHNDFHSFVERLNPSESMPVRALAFESCEPLECIGVL